MSTRLPARCIGLLLFILQLPFIAPAQAPEEVTPWKGFERVNFMFQGRKAWYVRPAAPVEGNPWVWRAHFPEWHTEMDSILLTRGFHIAYVNTNDLLGHPSALLVWDDFYDYMVREKKMAPRVALEAVSRGGLYAYGWAKRNPSKVSCIYAEAPVCDPLSWPGGKGKGKGAPAEWEKWLRLYGLDETRAAEFGDIPLNDLEGLAAYKVPVLHVVGPKDVIVPNEENTYKLVERYVRAGGPATVYTMTRGEQKLEGHHFAIEDPALFADFIQRHSFPASKPLSSASYIESFGGLERAFRKFETGKKGTVAFLGGSITYSPGWRTMTIQYLQERFPDTDFQFISAGIPSLGSTPHAFRFGRDVLENGIPDLLFVESAVNDRANGFGEEAQVRALEGICRQMIAANPSVSLVLMAFADPEKLADYEAGREPAEVTVHRRIARHYHADFINLSGEVYDRIKAGEFSWKYDFIDLHPSPYGQKLYANAIKTLFRMDRTSARKDPLSLPVPLDPRAYGNAGYLAPAKAANLSGFRYDPVWKPADGASVRKGFTEVPMLVAETEGASFDLEFTGRAIGIAVVAGPDAGSIMYRIDKGPVRKLDLFTQWSSKLHLPWYLMLDDGLKPGKHRLTVTISPEKNARSQGNACRIVHFLRAE